MKSILAFAFALLALVLPAAAVELQPNTMLDWSGDDGDAQVFTAGDLTLTLRLTAGEGGPTGTLTVEKPGGAPIGVSGFGAGSGEGQVGIVDFEAGSRSVVFAIHSGGESCCMQITALTETAGGWVTADVGAFDGHKVLPKDIDGDGTYELQQTDDRFEYLFNIPGLSLAPPMILKARDGVFRDASMEPAYRKSFEEMIAYAHTGCGIDGVYHLGVCGGMLGAAARTGTFDTEAAAVYAALATRKPTSGWREFSVCFDADCSESETYADFRQALEIALTAWGYLPRGGRLDR